MRPRFVPTSQEAYVEEIEVALDDYCFCSCHTEMLQTAITDLPIPKGVHKRDAAERVSACNSCHVSHVEAEFDSDDESWRS